MPRYTAQGKKTVDAFLKNRDAWGTLQDLGRSSPEDDPALEPLRTAARAFSGRLGALDGMPERPYEVVEQEAVETAQQLQTALNDLSAKKPELYRQQAGAFERAWQELGLELEGAEPQARVQEAPKAQEAAKVDFSTVDSRAFMRYMARAAKNNGPEWKHLDELTRRIESSKAKEKLEIPRYFVNRMKEDSMRTIRTVDTPEESAGDYSIGGIGLQKLRKHMKQLQNADPKLYGEVFGPFVQAMGKIDFTQEQASYSELEQKQEAEQAEEKEQERQAQEEAMRRKVTLYGNVEVTDNTGIYHFDRIRNDIVNDPGFREDPPSIDPQQMARLIFVTANATDFGVDQPLSPDFKDAIESESKRMLKGTPTYYERLAKEPEVARLLSQREEGQTWYATSQRKLAGYMLDVFDKRHEPNRASEEARKAAAAALTEAYDTMREYGSTLQDAGNEEIGVFYKCLREAQSKQGNSRAADNLDLAASGRAFLDSITAPGTEQTTETRECFKATLTAMRALSPADEFAQVCRDMNERRGIADNPADLDYVTPEMFDAKDLKSGLKLIDDLKKNLKTDESARDAAAKIMAARILTNTKGGKASYLDMPISQTRVDQVAAALKGSESFSRWLGGMDKNKAARLLSGHGGDLEKSFKDHLKKLPAGELKNDPALRRYMPTAKERIEELQKQAEAAGKERKELRKRYAGMYKEYKVKRDDLMKQMAEKGVPENEVNTDEYLEEDEKALRKVNKQTDEADLRRAKAAAETIAIRNACRVERGGAGLGRQIPPVREGSNIADTVSTLVGDDDCRTLLSGQAVQDALQSGHGGQMMVEARKGSADARISVENQRTLYENTVRFRKEALKAEADRLYMQIEEKPTEALVKQTRRVVGEYAALVIHPSTRDNPEQDMKWQAINKAAIGSETDPVFTAMIPDADHAQAALDWVSDLSEGEFRQKLSQRTNAVQGREPEKASAPDAAEKKAEEKKAEKRNEETEDTYDFLENSFDLG